MLIGVLDGVGIGDGCRDGAGHRSCPEEADARMYRITVRPSWCLRSREYQGA
jgi:hypothetical protein